MTELFADLLRARTPAKLREARLGSAHLGLGRGPRCLELREVQARQLLSARDHVPFAGKHLQHPAGELEAQVRLGGFHRPRRLDPAPVGRAVTEEEPADEGQPRHHGDHDPDSVLHRRISSAASIHPRSRIPWARARPTRARISSYRARA